MKKCNWMLGFAASVLLIVILLISSVDIAAYSSYGYYEKEYKKYDVLSGLNMEMKDARYVTEEMMSYLRGEREDLVVQTTVSGEKREFFNDREKKHMADVRNLFIWGLIIRRIAVIFLIVIFATMIGLKMKIKTVLAKSYEISCGVFLGITALLALLFSTDFTKYFTIFHEMFFTNDLWLLDPETDLLIRLLPEGFFIDMAIRIGVVFVLLLGLGIGISVLSGRKEKPGKAVQAE